MYPHGRFAIITYMTTNLKRRAQVAKHELLADLLRDKEPVCEALIKAGYPPEAARKGWDAVPKVVMQMVIHGSMKDARIGEQLATDDSDVMKHAVLGNMYERMTTGGKDGVQAAKILTTHKSIAAEFVQEAQQNVVVIQAPSDWKPGSIDAIKANAASKAVPQLTELPELPEYE